METLGVLKKVDIFSAKDNKKFCKFIPHPGHPLKNIMDLIFYLENLHAHYSIKSKHCCNQMSRIIITLNKQSHLTNIITRFMGNDKIITRLYALPYFYTRPGANEAMDSVDNRNCAGADAICWL